MFTLKTQDLMEKNWLFLQFLQNLDGALTQSHVSTVGEAHESYFTLRITLITSWPLCSPRLRYWSWRCSWPATWTTGTPACRLPRTSHSATGTETAGTSLPWTTPLRAPHYCEQQRRGGVGLFVACLGLYIKVLDYFCFFHEDLGFKTSRSVILFPHKKKLFDCVI